MNMKKIKKSVKKSTKNNYRIEALEPRLMMSADPVIDVDDLSNLSTQFETISKSGAFLVIGPSGRAGEGNRRGLG